MDVSDNVGYEMTLSILNTTNNKVISRHNVRPTGELTSPNLRIDPITAPEVVTFRNSSYDYVEDNEESPDDTKE